MTERFETQGEGGNALPHLLVATISPGSNGGVEWTVKCPYEGRRECGSTEECFGTPADVEKWGCEPFPEMPEISTAVFAKGVLNKLVGKETEEWAKFEAARDRWVEEVHDGHEWHRTAECWFEYAIKDVWGSEPEFYLSKLPADMEINGPIKVMVGYDGYGEEVEPLFKLWEEPTNADS